MYKKMKSDNRGFTLVELIIVMAIMGVLAVVAVSATSMIYAGNSKKSAAKYISELNTTQMDNMTHSGKTFLYLYKDGNDVYSARINTTSGDGYTSVTDVKNDTSASKKVVKITNSRVTITYGSHTLDETNMFKVGFDKSTGKFTVANSGGSSDTSFCDNLIFSGKENYQVKLVQSTGKHYIKK